MSNARSSVRECHGLVPLNARTEQPSAVRVCQCVLHCGMMRVVCVDIRDTCDANVYTGEGQCTIRRRVAKSATPGGAGTGSAPLDGGRVALGEDGDPHHQLPPDVRVRER